ncbi:MAG TPA: mercury methylation ferredoxin HgcB [Bacteroidales bacterium]|nr:mercury methylation ferredoxin HgcB [Bacteroidales bacterium]
MNGFGYLTDVVTLELDGTVCNGCKMCLHVCPHGVFGFVNQCAIIQNKDRCMECGACEMNCSQGAIRVKSGVGCAAGILNGLIRGTEPTCDCSGGGSCC